MSDLSTTTLRCVHPQDTAGIQALIDRVYGEYGDRLNLEGAEADLLDVVGAYGRSFVVLDRDRTIVGSHAVAPLEDRLCTFRRLYLAPELRGTDWGPRLMQWAIDWARAVGFERVEFWSDTRFTRAHRFFEKLGFQRDGRRREMDDGHQPYAEFFFYRDLDG